MDKKKLEEYSWEQQLIYNFEKLEKKIDENNKEIFNYVDKKIEDLKTDLKEGINKLWDKKDIDSEKIHQLQIMSNNNKTRIEDIEIKVEKLENQKNSSMSKNFYIVLNIITTITTGIIIGVILYFIKK